MMFVMMSMVVFSLSGPVTTSEARAYPSEAACEADNQRVLQVLLAVAKGPQDTPVFAAYKCVPLNIGDPA
jgi:hypothetical protein